MAYDHKQIEAKCLQKWENEKIYETETNPDGKPVYVLGMFPYPSGAGLHVGHVRIYTACDVMARYFRMKGDKLLFPMGWDAFGLPAENAAIKEKKNPIDMVPRNEANFKRQMQMMGLSYDWSREFSTTDPQYYKWTQWLFEKLYSLKNNKGERLIYRQEVAINWCPFCKTGLANEEVLPNGTHERCGNPVEKKMLPQWVMRITQYADRLLQDLDTVEWTDETGKLRKGLDWPAGILEMQRNWIGKKEGINVKFHISNIKFQTNSMQELNVFTTRIDTIFGVTFIVVAPEIVKQWMDRGWIAPQNVRDYVDASFHKTEEQRQVEERQKTGVDTGLTAINPVDGSSSPIWVADYVLANFGTGVVMGVPAHDERDWDFAKKFNLEVKQVIQPQENGSTPFTLNQAFTNSGVLINSGQFNGFTSAAAMAKIPAAFPDQMTKEVSYHLRDWVFSRQRYWGEPFPLIYCDRCGDENGVVTVPEDQLPVKLPYLQSYEPTDTGESPLTRATDWVNTTCPQCGGPAHRETDTMPNWAGSCWYFLHYVTTMAEDTTHHTDQTLWQQIFAAKFPDWMPINWYLGGAEHAVLHLLYARFWVKAFQDLGLLNFSEPFSRLRSVGMVLAEDGRKMSKSFGNVINPDDVVKEFGADAVRLYEMFMGPWDATIAWDTRALVGCQRFLDRIWKLVNNQLSSTGKQIGSDDPLRSSLHRTLQKVTADIPEQKFNTAIAAMMEFVNEYDKYKQMSLEDLSIFIRMIAPFAPFMAEELWYKLNSISTTRLPSDPSTNLNSVHLQPWPEWDPQLITGAEYLIVVQVNGKVRQSCSIAVSNYASWQNPQSELAQITKTDPKVNKWLEGKEVIKEIFIPPQANKQGIMNFIVR